MKDQNQLYADAVALLKTLIATPSPSREEAATADLLVGFMRRCGIADVRRSGNNVWARNRWFDPAKPTILLNSHHDTVPPNAGYTRSPFEPVEEDGKLYGLGSNDAGASLVSLLALFRYFYEERDMRSNLCIALTAEEEVSGRNGMESLVPQLGEIDFALVGEPTEMQMAIAERGLVVLDCHVTGRAGHAARNEGDNAIYKALPDIEWFRTYRFPKESDLLGPVKMTVTVIQAGDRHNVVPDRCTFTVDVRVNDRYTNAEVVEEISRRVSCEVVPRSLRLMSSSIPEDHPVVLAGKALGRTCYGSPTMSDQAFLRVPSLKMGVGHSSRSHIADEYVYLHEIKEGIALYIALIDRLVRGAV